MATTKALELGQFGTDLTVDDSTGAVTIANDVTINAATSTGIDDNATTTKLTISDTAISATTANFQLTGGYNFEWGDGFLNGDPAIWANTTQKKIRIGPSGNTDGEILVVGTYGIDVNGDVKTTGTLKGPSLFYIDPATYETDSDGSSAGSAAGTVRIRGDLIVDGDTTTINSTTLTVDDLNIVLASGAADSATADGAGITIDGASATLTYSSTDDKFVFNKALDANYTRVISSGAATNPTDGTSLEIHYVTSGRTQGEGAYLIPYDRDNSQYKPLTVDAQTIRLVGGNTLIADNLRTDTFVPSQRLHVYDPSTAYILAETGGTGTSAGHRATAGTNDWVWFATEGQPNYRLYDYSSSAVRLTVKNNGYVGIGTENPSTKLEVNGEILATVLSYNNGTGSATSLSTSNLSSTLNSGSKGFQIITSASFTAKNASNNPWITANDDGVDLYSSATKRVEVTDDGINVVSGSYRSDQVRHSIRPTLNLDFANSKQLDPRITFYRDSIATYYDSKGVLRYANANEPRFDHNPATGESKGLLIEEARTNLTDKNNRFNDWHGKNRVDFIDNAAKSPDGYYNATKVIDAPNGVNARHEFWRNFSAVSGTTYTFSIYAKAAEHTMFNFVWYGDNGVFGGETYFDLDAVTATNGTGQNAKIEDVGNGWYRCSASRTSSATAAGYYGIYMVEESTSSSTYVGSNDGGLYFFGAQFEVGSFPTSYVPSDTRFTSRSSKATYYDETGVLRTAPVDSPRYGYSSPYATEHWAIVSTLKTKIGSSEPERSLKETGLILENAASNLENYSYNMDQSNHGSFVSSGGSFAVTDEVAAPDGSYTASKFVFGAGNDRMDDQHGAHNQGTYTFSMWVKGVAGEVVGMAILNNLGGNVEPYIYLTGEWQRISVTKTFDSQGTNIRTHGVIIRGAPGVGVYATGDDGGNGTLGTWANYVYVWGMQVEAGFTSTSYIPTRAGGATRSADVASSVAYTRAIDVAKINNITNEDWYNTREGSIYTDFYPLSLNSTDDVVVGVGDGTSRGFRAPWITSGGQIRIGNWSGVSYTALHYYNGITIENPHKSALSFSYEDAKFISSLDGSAAQSTSSWGGVETDATTIWIGGETDSNRPYNGHIGKVSIYNEALSEAELQALTENN